MQTQEIITFEPKTVEESDALKAFAKVLKLKFQISKSKSKENEILSDLKKAVKEMNLVKKGKIKARNVKELLHEL